MSSISPNPSRRRRFLAFSLIGGAVFALLFLALGFALQYSDQPSACGGLCHDQMEPQYATYKASTHARVACVSCHVGPSVGDYVQGKGAWISQGIKTLTNSYQRPIITLPQNLIPSRNSCERCHWPEKFYDDRVRDIVRYAPDKDNTESRLLLLMKTGGTTPGGNELGIHWHIKSKVYYIATDAEHRDIPWVGVVGSDGKLTEYLSTAAALSPADIQKVQQNEIDCVVCHNRATHVFNTPDQAIDAAMAGGRIDLSLPYVKKEGLVRLVAAYDSDQKAMSGIATLKDFYKETYPQVYESKKNAIDQAIQAFQDIYKANVFPKMKVTWGTYPNYLSHQGCFRCHDGKHKTADGRVITTDCNSCHQVLSSLAEIEK